MSPDARDELLRVDPSQLDAAVLRLFKPNGSGGLSGLGPGGVGGGGRGAGGSLLGVSGISGTGISVTASTIQAYGAALCQRAVKYCNMDDVKAALKFCRYHREFHYPELEELGKLASMPLPQLLQRQLLAAKRNRDQPAVVRPSVSQSVHPSIRARTVGLVGWLAW